MMRLIGQRLMMRLIGQRVRIRVTWLEMWTGELVGMVIHEYDHFCVLEDMVIYRHTVLCKSDR
jgi:hypothetical protein